MSTDVKAQMGRHRKNLGSRGQFTGALLGLGTGMGINASSDYAGFRGVAGVFAVSGVLTATSWLRQRQRAPLTLFTTRILLISALLTGVISIVGPKSWQASTTLGAAALTVTAALIHANFSAALTLLAGTGAVGVGSSYVMQAVASIFSDTNEPSDGTYSYVAALVASITLGVALIVYGVALMRNGHPLRGLSSVGKVAAPLIGGAANVVVGVIQAQRLSESEVAVYFPGYDPGYVNATLQASGLGIFLGGCGLIGIAVANVRSGDILRVTSIAFCGLGCFLFGVPILRIEPFSVASTFGVTGAFILGGLALLAVALSYVRNYIALRAGAIVAGGIAVIANSVLPGLPGMSLISAAGAAGGTALTVFGVIYFVQSPAFRTTKERLRALVEEPANGTHGRHRRSVARRSRQRFDRSDSLNLIEAADKQTLPPPAP